MKTIADIWNHALTNFSDMPAVRWLEKKDIKERTYKELGDNISLIKKGLKAEGFESAHVSLIGTASVSWIEAYLALTTGNNVAVPLDAGLPAEDLIELIQRADIENLRRHSATDHQSDQPGNGHRRLFELRQKVLDLEESRAPRFHKVDIRWDQSDCVRRPGDQRRHNDAEQGVLQAFYLPDGLIDEHCGNGQQRADKDGQGHDQQEQEQHPRVVIERQLRIDPVRDKKRDEKQKILFHLEYVVHEKFGQEYDGRSGGQGQQDEVIARKIQRLHQTDRSKDNGQSEHDRKNADEHVRGERAVQIEYSHLFRKENEEITQHGDRRKADDEKRKGKERLFQVLFEREIHLFFKLHHR